MAQSVLNVGSNSNANSSTITTSLGATATSGNVLIAMIIRRGFSNTPNTPSGYTSLNSLDTSNRKCDIFGKISDGTETEIIITSSNEGHQAVFFLELNDTTLTINAVEDALVSGTGTEVVFSGALTDKANVIALAIGGLEDDDYAGDAWSNSFIKQSIFEVATGTGNNLSVGCAVRVLTSIGTEGTTMSTTSGGPEQAWGTLIYMEAVAGDIHPPQLALLGVG